MAIRCSWELIKYCVIASTSVGATFSLAGPSNCTAQTRKLVVDRKQYKALQRLVNQGHQPWRMDAWDVASEEILTLENVPEQQYNVFRVPVRKIIETKQHAVYEYSAAEKTSYRIVLRRFPWLFSLAGKWEWTIWIPTEVTITCGAKDEARPQKLQ